MLLNLNKTKVLVFNKRGESTKIYYDGCELEKRV